MYPQRCHCNDDGMRLMAQGLAYAMTEFYILFRKPSQYQFLFLTLNKESVVQLRMPKHLEDNYKEKVFRFKKDAIALIDQGYSQGRIDLEVADKWRNEIGIYQQGRNEVWE